MKKTSFDYHMFLVSGHSSFGFFYEVELSDKLYEQLKKYQVLSSVDLQTVLEKYELDEDIKKEVFELNESLLALAIADNERYGKIDDLTGEPYDYSDMKFGVRAIYCQNVEFEFYYDSSVEKIETLVDDKLYEEFKSIYISCGETDLYKILEIYKNNNSLLDKLRDMEDLIEQLRERFVTEMEEYAFSDTITDWDSMLSRITIVVPNEWKEEYK